MDAQEFDHFIAANEYGFYCVPTAFRGREVPRLLRKGEVYEPVTLRFLMRHLGDGDIITGGAFVGDFFPALARSLAPDALIHSFEPAPLTFLAAERTIALNKLGQVRLHPVAIGAEEAVLPLQVSRKDGAEPLAAGARLVTGSPRGETVDVPVKPLDDLVPQDRRITLLHLDVEGHEVPALQGAARILRDHAPILVLETGRRKRRLEYLELLADLVPKHRYAHSSQIEENGIFLPLA